jgi:hypothetical protein
MKYVKLGIQATIAFAIEFVIVDIPFCDIGNNTGRICRLPYKPI